MNKTYTYMLLIITLLFSSKLIASNYNLTDYKNIYGGKVDYYSLGNREFENSRFIDSVFPDTEEIIDFDNQTVTLITKFNDFEIHQPVTLTFDEYFESVFAYTFDKLLYEETMKMFHLEERDSSSGLIPDLVFDLPKFARSKTVRRIFGDKAGRLSFSGSEKLTISATSTENDNLGLSESDNSSSFTPKMEQELDMKLKGTIGEKIHVDLSYNSNQEESFFNPNNINISYQGFEDEIVQSVEAGDISLDLSGNSQFVGSVSSSQGLFGIRTDMKIGDLELTAVASQEESEKEKQVFKNKAQSDSTEVNVKDYTRRDMYYVVNPYHLFLLYQDGDTIPGSSQEVPEGWVNNAIKMDENGSYLVFDADVLPADGTLEVYLDDANVSNNTSTIPGFEMVEADTPFIPQFDLLSEGTDYIYDYDSGVLKMLKTINKSYTIGVRYTQRNGVQIPTYDASNEESVYVKLLRVRNQSYLEDVDPKDFAFESVDADGDGLPDNRFYTWHLQARNVYSLNAQNIDNEDFSLRVFQETSNGEYDYDVPSDIDSGGFTTINDFLLLDTNGDGKVDGSDTSIDLSAGYVTYPMLEPFAALNDTLIYQDENESINSEEYTYQMVITGKIGKDEISLGHTNILRGSVVVKVNGNKQKENVDYIVDYDFGNVTFLTAAGKDPNAEITIDYEFKSGFGVDQRQLFGIRADYKGFENFNIGGTFIYRTESVQDKHPKIGEENIELMLADIDAKYQINPRFMTDMVDWLPLVETDVESKFELSSEVALSFPNIYGNPDGKKKEAYIDDMEGILDEYPLGVTRKTWSEASKPANTSMPKARTHWFNPENILMKEVYDPSTMDSDQEEEEVSVLAMKIVPPEISSPNIVNRSWGGVMKYIGNQVDFSEKKYVEILAKIDTTYGSQEANVTLHIDLGDISEDFYTFNGGEGFLNTEDGISDGIIDGILDVRTEDVGLDGVKNGLPGDDPLDSSNDNQNSDGDYLFINGTEGNNELDTEDLDGNGTLNTLNRYFEYSIPLSSNNFDFLESEYRGWKLYRIPISDQDIYNAISNTTGINPDLSKISYARVWAEVDKTVRITIAELNVVGNKWEERPVLLVDTESSDDHFETSVPQDELDANNTSFIVGITDNQKDNHYTPPSGTFTTSEGEETLEQSLNISINNLQEGQLALVRQKSTESTNMLLYNSLRFWVYPELEQGELHTADSLNVIIRLGADSLNYYEIKEKVAPIIYATQMSRNNWKEVDIDFSEITELKNLNMASNSDNDTLYVDGLRSYRKVGNPTLSSIKELNLGVQPLAGSEFSGKVYFNDIRVADPYENSGYKARVTMNSKFADLYTINVDINQESENFVNKPDRSTTSSSFMETSSISVKNNFSMHKFFNDDWNITMPLTFDYSKSSSIPRFKANSDILRDDLSDFEKDLEKTESTTYKGTWSFRKGKTDNPWMDYTLGSLSLSADATLSDNITSTRADTTFKHNGTLAYDLNLGSVNRGFKIWDDLKINLFPSEIENTVTFNSTNPDKYKLTRTDTLIYWEDDTASSNQSTRAVKTENYVEFPLITAKNKSYLSSSYKIETERDLTYKNRINNINIGEESDYKQTITYNFAPELIPSILDVNSNGQVVFNESRSQKSNSYTYDDEEEDEDIIKFKHDGSVNRTFNVDLVFNNSDLLSDLADYLRSRTPNSPKKDGDKAKEDYDPKESKDPKEEKELEEAKEDKDRGREDVKASTPENAKYLKEIERLKVEIKELDKKKNDIKDEKDREEIERQLKEMRDRIVTLYDLNDALTSGRPGKDGDKPKEDKDEKDDKESNRESFSYISIIDWVAGFSNLEFGYKNDYNMNYKNLDNRPQYQFQLGIPYSLDPDLIEVKDNNNQFDAETRFSYKNFNTSIYYTYENNKRWSSNSSQTIITTFPEIDINVTDIQSYFGFGDILTSSSIGTGYTYEVEEKGDIGWSKPDSRTVRTNFAPMFSWTGNWANNVITTASYNQYSTKTTEDKNTFDKITNDKDQTVTGSVSWSFKAVEGFKLPLIGSSIRLKNDMTLRTNVNWTKNYMTEKGSSETLVRENKITYSVIPEVSYKFHKNIDGGSKLSYEMTQDKKSNRDVKKISFSLWVKITF